MGVFLTFGRGGSSYVSGPLATKTVSTNHSQTR
jgi:hypothetical protein